MNLLVWRFLTLVVTALSLGPSFAHALEALPRLTVWSPELWREATVFNGQYQVFGWLGGPLDGGSVLVTAVLAYRLRKDRAGFWFALVGAILFAASLAVWLSVVAPVNGILATWQPGPVPGDFLELRNRWEFGHIVMAPIKLAGFMAVVLSTLARDIPVRASRSRIVRKSGPGFRTMRARLARASSRPGIRASRKREPPQGFRAGSDMRDRNAS